MGRHSSKVLNPGHFSIAGRHFKLQTVFNFKLVAGINASVRPVKWNVSFFFEQWRCWALWPTLRSHTSVLMSCERGFPNFPFNIVLLSTLTHNRKEDSVCVCSSAAVCPESKSLWLLWKSNPDTVFTALKDPLTFFVSVTGTQTWENKAAFSLAFILHRKICYSPANFICK